MKKSSLKLRVLVSVLLMVIIIALTATIFVKIYNQTRDRGWQTLKEATITSEARLASYIRNFQASLKNCANVIASLDDLKSEQTEMYVNDIAVSLTYAPLRLYLPDGYAVTENGVFTDFSKTVKYDDIVAKGMYITTVKNDIFDNNKEIVEMYMPVKKGNEVVAMLCTIIDLNETAQFLKIENLSGKANMIVIDTRDKSFIMDSYHERVFREPDMDFKTVEDITMGDWINAVMNGASNKISIIDEITGEKTYITGIKFSQAPWIVTVGAPEGIVLEMATTIRGHMIKVLIAELVIFILYFIWTYFDINKQLAFEKEETIRKTLEERKEQIREERQQKIVQSMKLIQVLSDAYDLIYYADAETGKYEIFYTEGFSKSGKTDYRKTSGENLFKDAEKNIRETVHRDDLDEMIKLGSKEGMAELLKDNDTVTIDSRILIDGEYVWYRDKITKFVELDGSVKYVIGIMNISDEMSIKAEKQRDMEIIEALASEYASVYYVNLETQQLTPYSMNKDTRMSFLKNFKGNVRFSDAYRLYVSQFVSEKDQAQMIKNGSAENIQKMLEKQKSFSTIYTNQIGRYCEMRVVKVGENIGIPNMVALGFMDCDEKMRNEMQAKETLENALEMAKSASEAKTAFLSAMSHDIRTPMNAIIGYTDLAQLHVEETDKVREYLAKINQSSNHLMSLINDVLDMSRIETGRITLDTDRECIPKNMEMVKNLVQGDMDKKNFNFKVTGDIEHNYIICDRLRINQVILNTLSNAMKYTQAGGDIEFSVVETVSRKHGCGHYIFTVKDNGMGMSEDFLKIIFEPFTRVQSSTMSGIPGTGLGMAISKNIVDMMGGKIYVESELGKGTTVTMELDLEIAEDIPVEEDVSEDENLESIDRTIFKGKKVLLVEDNPVNQEIAIELLEDDGFVVELAENGRVAVEKFMDSYENRYDLILMDIQMPEMDGYEATTTIRKIGDAYAANIPILAMTANAFETDRRKAFSCGMNEHIAKPLDMDTFENILRKFIR